MAGDMDIFEPTERYIGGIIRHLPSYASKFDPHAYINWELKEFDKQMMRTSSTITRWQRRNWPSWPNCSRTVTV